jgi:hypothetical protein
LAVGLLVLAAAAAAAWLLVARGADARRLDRAFAAVSAGELAHADVFRWTPGRDDGLLLAGRDGLGHRLWSRTRGGVERTAALMDRLEPFITRSARRFDVSKQTLAALVFVESGGRADLTVEPQSSAGRAGLGGLKPDIARELGLAVDLAASSELTARIAEQVGHQAEAESKAEAALFAPGLIRMRERRRRVDERFDVVASLDATAERLRDGLDAFGREDLAVAAYRIGVPGLWRLLRREAGGGRPRPGVVARRELTYPRLYLDGGPARETATDRRLARLGPEVSQFPFTVEAARQILALWSDEPARLYRLASLHGVKPAADDVLWPPGSTPTYASHNALDAGFADGSLVRLPADPARAGFELAPGSERVFDNELHRGLRPEALAALMYIAGAARSLARDDDLTLQLAGAVRPETLKRRLAAAGRNVGGATWGAAAIVLPREYERTPASTGYSFDLARGLPARHTRALDSVLARLQALDVVAVHRGRDADTVTVSPRAREILEQVLETS